jgi:hypothetical protein
MVTGREKFFRAAERAGRVAGFIICLRVAVSAILHSCAWEW